MNLQSYFRVKPFQSIEIQVDKRDSQQCDSYTTGDLIEGIVRIQTDAKLTPQDVEVTFCGDSQALSEGVFLPVSTYRKKRFLDIQQPINEADLSPVDSDKTGFLYQIPFSFVIPDQLPVQICRHIRDGWDEDCGHLMLPPTLGKDPSRKNQFSLDDMGCNSMSIVYSVQAKVKSQHVGRNKPPGPWNFAFKSIPVIPTCNILDQDDTPSIPDSDSELELPTHTFYPIDAFQCDTWKGPLSARAWILGPIELRFPHHNNPEHSASLIQVELEFQSAHPGREPPPSLRHVSRKLFVHTIAYSMPFRPTITGPAYESLPEINSRTVLLGKMDTSSVKFQPQLEHDSDSDEGEDSPKWSNNYLSSNPPSKKVYYTASIQVPIILPDNKTFVPSFESCMISRCYELEIGVHYSSGWKGLGTSCLSIPLPLQIVT